jgi:hypothetical protein
MTAKPDLDALRSKAGKRYAAAVGELQESLVDLAALETLLAHQRKSIATDGKAPNLLTFGADAPDNVPGLRHREFVPSPPSKLKVAIAARAEEIQARAG